jgi:hypothetical protein
LGRAAGLSDGPRPRVSSTTKPAFREGGWAGAGRGITAGGRGLLRHVRGLATSRRRATRRHRVVATLKARSVGVYHCLRWRHSQAYLDAFVFRFNRRYSRDAAFRRLLGLGTKVEPITYNMLVKPEAGA